MNVEQNMALFQEMIQCAAPVYTWVYDAQAQLLSSNCPDETVLMQAFSAFGCKTVLCEYAAENTAPVLLTSPVGLVWAAALEKARGGELLRAVREGDINYKRIMNQANNVSSGIPVISKDSLRQAKTSVIVFTSLCARAAIEGGLSPDQAYSLGDSYIQQAEDGTDIGELAAVSNAMYDDFIRRVHRCRTNPNVSRQIQECCNYIEMHVEDDLEIETLARRVGYAEYYLTKKFKEEMHVSLNNYIKFVRVERAKLLLTTTDLSVQEIADRLGFCSRSYMGKTFREVAGCSPMDYRREHRRG